MIKILFSQTRRTGLGISGKLFVVKCVNEASSRGTQAIQENPRANLENKHSQFKIGKPKSSHVQP